MKLLLRCLLLGAWVVSPSLWAWSNHTVGSYLALRELAAIREAPEVEVEPLEAFLAAERGGLAALLDEQEAYARAHIGNYPARPDALRFAAEGEAGDLRQAFLAALRVNPEIRLALALQPLPGQDQPQRPHLKPQEVLVFQNLSPWTAWRFIRLEPGERVAPLAVLATAADEPDYGHDINLFSDNPGEAGQRYGFGTQPFGDPRFEFSSQAPFHMGFYHEAAVIYSGAPFLARAWPEWRAYQYFGLSRFAFANGHPYWGYRFLGWGMHYIQDITQPYHSTPLPGASLAAMLQMEGKALLGYPEESRRPSSVSRTAIPRWRNTSSTGCANCSATAARSRCSTPTPTPAATVPIRPIRRPTCATWWPPSRTPTPRPSTPPSANGWPPARPPPRRTSARATSHAPRPTTMRG